MSRQEAWKDERGFTLAELLITIVIMGIVLAIASFSWVGAIESRRVDSATNQVTVDLRTAHSRATNRLVDYSFVAPASAVPPGVDPLSTYETGPTDGTLVFNKLPDGTQITATNIKFKGDGSAQVVSGANPITVGSSKDAANNHTIDINIATSRIKVVP